MEKIEVIILLQNVLICGIFLKDKVLGDESVKRTIISLVLVLSIVCLCSCTATIDRNEPSSEATTVIEYKTLPHETQSAIVGEKPTVNVPAPGESESASAPNTTAPTTTEPQVTPATEVETGEITEPPITQKQPQKTGEMEFSDSPENKYINAVVKKYGTDPKKMVVFYTVPDGNGNIVLEFNGTTDENGKLIRNKDTLVAIYTVDKELNSKRASKDKALNEYPYGEMMVIFLTTTTHIMPEFEAELNG